MLNHNLRGIRAIFFDAGGTLIHLDAPRICALLRDELGLEAVVDRFPRAQSMAMRHVAKLVAAGHGSTEQLKDQFYGVLLPEVGIPQEKVPVAAACVLKLARAEMLWRKYEEAIPSVLLRLKERGLLLAVVSNSDGRIESAFAQAG
ncbi:MAG TPA: HAD family hydrolase, partial [Blastocatellia bacterium]|nr:HAD family hydrolase [Blastocatellia bacterium]